MNNARKNLVALNAIDDNMADLERVKYLLQLFDEQLTEYVDLLRKGDPGSTNLFLSRFHILSSLLESAEIQLSDSIKLMMETLEAA